MRLRGLPPEIWPQIIADLTGLCQALVAEDDEGELPEGVIAVELYLSLNRAATLALLCRGGGALLTMKEIRKTLDSEPSVGYEMEAIPNMFGTYSVAVYCNGESISTPNIFAMAATEDGARALAVQIARRHRGDFRKRQPLELPDP